MVRLLLGPGPECLALCCPDQRRTRAAVPGGAQQRGLRLHQGRRGGVHGSRVPHARTLGAHHRGRRFSRGDASLQPGEERRHFGRRHLLPRGQVERLPRRLDGVHGRRGPAVDCQAWPRPRACERQPPGGLRLRGAHPQGRRRSGEGVLQLQGLPHAASLHHWRGVVGALLADHGLAGGAPLRQGGHLRQPLLQARECAGDDAAGSTEGHGRPRRLPARSEGPTLPRMGGLGRGPAGAGLQRRRFSLGRPLARRALRGCAGEGRQR
mmetsp:Transcript_76943/g.220361  ORF Transcript_76943/g.220361 Transcript_76943/m.220361 type:complete len:266 (-) Transcript_76943:79-876(-)